MSRGVTMSDVADRFGARSSGCDCGSSSGSGSKWW